MYKVPCCCYPLYAVMQPGEELKPDQEPTRYSMQNAARVVAEGGRILTGRKNVLESDGKKRSISRPERRQLMAMSEDWKQQS